MALMVLLAGSLGLNAALHAHTSQHITNQDNADPTHPRGSLFDAGTPASPYIPICSTHPLVFEMQTGGGHIFSFRVKVQPIFGFSGTLTDLGHR